MKKTKTLNKPKTFDIYNKKSKMKKLNQTYIDNLINKVISETLEEKANKLVSKIKGKIPTDEDVEEMMSSEVNEKMDTCEECGAQGRMMEGECMECGSRNMYEGEFEVGDLNNAPTEFDYVAEDKDFEVEDELAIMSADDDGDPLDRVNRFCSKDSDEYNEESCKYHKKLEGEMFENLHGGQKKLDKNKNGKIDAEDFEMLRKGKKEKPRTPAGFEYGELVSGEEEVEEGNAFTAKLKQTPKGGKFKLGGKEYTDTSNIGESKKFIQKATEKMDKKGTEGKFGAWCKRNGLASDEGEVTKKCIDKAMKSENSEVVKMANFAKNIKGYSGSEHKKESVKLKESEIIDLIEKIIKEEKKVKDNIKLGTAKGLEKYKQVHQKDGKENDEALRATAKKMKDYLKDASKGEYETNPKHFPKGNGELAKMSKKAYVMSDSGKEFVDDYMRPGMEDLVPDEIQYDEKWVEDNIKGSSRTGNNPKWGNAEETDLGEKISKKQKEKKYRKAKDQAYRKSKQPVTDGTGENSGEGVNIKLENIDNKKINKLNEEFNRMKSLIGYNQKTQ